MALVRWSPTMWPSFFDDDFKSLMDWPDISSTTRGLDIYETDDEVIVEAQVPGIPEHKVNVTVEGNVLSISANHEETEEEKKKKKTVYKATRQTTFNYTTNLPRMVDAAKAVAEVVDGVVKVTIPKTEEEKPRKIDIKKAVK